MIRRLLSLSLLLVLLLPALLPAQGVTSGSLSGKVVADSDGSALPGATITLIHEPTTGRQVTVADESGRFRFPYSRVGGPYTLRVELAGFQTVLLAEVQVQLGETTDVSVRMPLETVAETVTVVGESGQLINAGRTGAGSSVSTQALETLPTISRSLNDFARTNPLFGVTAQNQDPDALSVAGRSSRYNSISIDGAVNNDTFGLAGTGTPGGQAGTNPISLDAIQELQLVVAPYDVRQGGFSGGGINAVTRSGGNRFETSVFYYRRDDRMVGDGPDSLGQFGEFEEEQVGFRFGGPLVENRAFFFLNADLEERSQPSGWSIDGSGGQAFLGGDAVDEAERFRSILIDRYGYDPGGLGQDTSETPSDKYFLRFDLNLSDQHQLVLRHNKVDASRGINRPSSRTYEFPSEAYAFSSSTDSTVAQWVGQLGSRAYNELRITRQLVEDRRSGRDGIDFPWVEIENAIPGSGREFEAGTEPFSTANSLDQEIYEFHNDLNLLRGDHALTIGTHNEFFSFDNLFVPNSFGAYEFTDLDAFDAGIARRFQRSIANSGDGSVEFDVAQYGLYFGDQWKFRDNVSFTLGLRFDLPVISDSPAFNPDIEATYGYRTDEMPSDNLIVSPRFGFNWSPTRGSDQLRGGIGVFAGRTPYVWISNQFSNNGLEQTSLTAFGVPFNPDPRGQPSSLEELGGFASTQSVDLIDPDFEFPQVLRVDLGYERRLPWWDLVASFEAIYTDSLKEIDYRNLNLVQTGTQFDGRPLYGSMLSSDFGGAYLITNTSGGDSTNVVAKLERTSREGVWGFVSYVWGDSNSVNDGSSSRAVSNFQFNEVIDPNAARVFTSEYEVEHRFNASISTRVNRSSRWPTTISAFYNLQSGRPYSSIYRFSFPSINGDTFGSNDLIYVPAGPDDVIIANGTWEQLDAYIRGDEGLDAARGGIVGRNASQAPWNHTFDIHLSQQIPVKLGHLNVSLDLLNLMNLIDSDSGTLRYAQFNTLTPVRFDGVDADTGKPIYTLDPTVTDPENNPKFSLHNTTSRWKLRFGVRWTF